MSPIPSEIQSYYLRDLEKLRLSADVGELERIRTQKILSEHLPPPPAAVVDVGGASGAHAIALAQAGYHVHLIDPVQIHLEQARLYSTESRISLASITLGDARSLTIESTSVDAVLLLGPLYHLVERTDRLLALREARRILKPGGIAFAAGISRFASLMDGLTQGFIQDSDFCEIIEGDLRTGQHRNPTNNPDYFTTAYFHRPDELRDEVSNAGFENAKLIAVEGIAWSPARFSEAWRNPEVRRNLLEFLARTECEPSILGASAHFLVVAQRS